MIAVVDEVDLPQPLYPDEERKAGIAGKMGLSLTLNPDGHVKEIHVVNSLSPSLDKNDGRYGAPFKIQAMPE